MEREVSFSVECPNCYEDVEFDDVLELNYGYAEIDMVCESCGEPFMEIYNEEYDHDY